MTAEKPLILVVDDLFLWHAEFERVLGEEYEVHCATTAAEARVLLREHQYAAIIMDGKLGRGDPEETTVQLTRDVRQAGFAGPIFAASALPSLKARQLEAGCSHELDKGSGNWLQRLIDALSRNPTTT